MNIVIKQFLTISTLIFGLNLHANDCIKLKKNYLKEQNISDRCIEISVVKGLVEDIIDININKTKN